MGEKRQYSALTHCLVVYRVPLKRTLAKTAVSQPQPKYFTVTFLNVICNVCLY